MPELIVEGGDQNGDREILDNLPQGVEKEISILVEHRLDLFRKEV